MRTIIKTGAIAALLMTSAITSNCQATFNPTGDSSLPDVLVTSTRFAEKKKNIVQKVDVITNDYIRKTNAQNTGDLLMSTGNVFVQKSQQGGSSVVLRGFEASRVLLMVDGIRMNNAVYRSGHLQNVITVDQNMLERIEVTNGPGSTLNGSDALGGVVSMKTKDPLLDSTGKKVLSGHAFARYSSANEEKTGHLMMNFGKRKFAALISGTFSDFGDMKMGDKYRDKYPNFGRRSYYVERINNIDSVVKNNDDRVQKFSGYRQWDLMSKLLWKANDRSSHLINLQVSNSSDVPRYDRLQDIRNGNLRYAEWYYGPQQRALFAYTYNRRLSGFFQEFRFTASYQDLQESRHQRDRNNLLRQNRVEDIGVAGFYIDLRRAWQKHELHTGVDVQLNDVKSSAYRQNINTGERTALDTRYPEKNKMNSYGVYVQHLLKFSNEKWVLNDGVRLQASQLNSTIIDKSTAFRPFDKIEQNLLGVSGNAGLVYSPSNKLRVAFGIATAFRAPNVDDVTKIFESSTSARQLVIPNPDLRPEKTVSPDFNFTWKPADFLQLEGSAFYTWFLDAIVKDRYKVNGQDSTLYDGTKYLTLASVNAASARLHGFSAGVILLPGAGLKLHSTINFTNGTYQRSNGSKVPLDHIPPVFGKTGLSWQNKRVMAEVWGLYNGWKHIEDYNPDGEDNAQYATPEGMPSWVTLNMRLQVSFGKMLTLQAAAENIFDRNYRVFASGFSAAGRNLVMAVRLNF